MDKELLTIKEFAEAAGVSRQYIYKVKDTILKPYVQMQDRLIVIHRDGLKVIRTDSTNSTIVEQPIKPDSTANKKDFQPEVEKVESTNSTLVEMLEKQVMELQKDKDELRKQLQQKDEQYTRQLQVKDDQIAAYIRQLDTKDQQIADYTQRLSEAHYVMALEHHEKEKPEQETRDAEEYQEQTQPGNDVVSEVAEPAVDKQPEDPDQVAAAAADDPGRTEETVKVRWWKRLWKKKE